MTLPLCGARSTRPGEPDAAGRSALVHVLAFGLLALATVFVASVTSVGLARAQNVNAAFEPDTSFVVAMLAFAVVLMSGLSAAAVRFAGRSRER